MIYPKNFFDFAEDLVLFHNLIGSFSSTHQLNSTNRECVLRTIIDRSYYAVFLTAKTYLESVDGETIPKRDTHRTVIDLVKNSNTLYPNGLNISSRLYQLKKKREEASYDIGSNFTLGEAQRVITNSKDTIDLFPSP